MKKFFNVMELLTKVPQYYLTLRKKQWCHVVILGQKLITFVVQKRLFRKRLF